MTQQDTTGAFFETHKGIVTEVVKKEISAVEAAKRLAEQSKEASGNNLSDAKKMLLAIVGSSPEVALEIVDVIDNEHPLKNEAVVLSQYYCVPKPQ